MAAVTPGELEKMMESYAVNRWLGYKLKAKEHPTTVDGSKSYDHSMSAENVLDDLTDARICFNGKVWSEYVDSALDKFTAAGASQAATLGLDHPSGGDVALLRSELMEI